MTLTQHLVARNGELRIAHRRSREEIRVLTLDASCFREVKVINGMEVDPGSDAEVFLFGVLALSGRVPSEETRLTQDAQNARRRAEQQASRDLKVDEKAVVRFIYEPPMYLGTGRLIASTDVVEDVHL